jgi:short-subunit dehydrogenase involved in D-alanine esterification of teichoic acids
MKLDLSDGNKIKEFSEEFKKKFNRLDMLINNAGVIMNKKVMTKDNLEMTVGINYYGHFYLTYNLIALLNQTQSRIVNVSSEVHRKLPK